MLKLRAAEYYKSHQENFGRAAKLSKRRKFAPVIVSAAAMLGVSGAEDCDSGVSSDYDKWAGDSGNVCFIFGDSVTGEIMPVADVVRLGILHHICYNSRASGSYATDRDRETYSYE